MNRRGVFKTLLGGAVAAAGVSTTPALARSAVVDAVYKNWKYPYPIDTRLHPYVSYDLVKIPMFSFRSIQVTND